MKVRWGGLQRALGVCAGCWAQGANLILINGRVWTENPTQLAAQAVALEGNRIAAVGSDAEISRLAGPATQVIDLRGRLLLPGFNDAHVHLLAGGEALMVAQVRYAIRSALMLEPVEPIYVASLPYFMVGNWTTARVSLHLSNSNHCTGRRGRRHFGSTQRCNPANANTKDIRSPDDVFPGQLSGPHAFHLPVQRDRVVIVLKDEGIANGQRVELCEDQGVTLRARNLAHIDFFFYRSRRVSSSHHEKRGVFMRVEPVRHAAIDPEDLSGPQLKGSLILIERDVAGHGEYGNHLFGCMLGNTLAGAQVQEDQPISGLVDQGLWGKCLLVEFDEILYIVLLHGDYSDNEYGYKLTLARSILSMP